MINFRYHIVSLMAVFIALSVGIAVGVSLSPSVDQGIITQAAVGIAVGVSLSPSVDQGIITQAAQDRKQVTDLRAELDRRNALDQYREAYDQRVGQVVAENVLSGIRVAIVAMPDAPTAVVEAISTAAEEAGGNVVREVTINAEVFEAEPDRQDQRSAGPVGSRYQLRRFDVRGHQGRARAGRSIAARGVLDRDTQHARRWPSAMP